ncbi:MAG: aminoglycoside phosphotransferase family protein [Verrucomicrobiaceae bacterium]|nr:aminoglycoside phosphotransferase family protein [Verrucomicrobiaceae bacterium]
MNRRDIYYWKCDRPAAFHGTQQQRVPQPGLEENLIAAMRRRFNARHISISQTASQGHHLTWRAQVDGKPMFVRVQDGEDDDGHLKIESDLMKAVSLHGVPTPEVFVMEKRTPFYPFAWQAMELVPHPDLNHWFKKGDLDVASIAFGIGAAVAKWQGIQPMGFGPLETPSRPRPSALVAGHTSYRAYFHVRLDQHLTFLTDRGFIDAALRSEIEGAITEHAPLLDLPQGCLVHKDLALWNILGTQDRIAAFIDFEDAISGDEMDDLSLLACFHDTAFVAQAFEGYLSVRPLPSEHRRRFWLHLLRNMIVKAVIRVGAGYFDRDAQFFLIGTGDTGADLRAFTLQRIHLALQGLRTDSDFSLL